MKRFQVSFKRLHQFVNCHAFTHMTFNMVAGYVTASCDQPKSTFMNPKENQTPSTQALAGWLSTSVLAAFSMTRYEWWCFRWLCMFLVLYVYLLTFIRELLHITLAFLISSDPSMSKKPNWVRTLGLKVANTSLNITLFPLPLSPSELLLLQHLVNFQTSYFIHVIWASARSHEVVMLGCRGREIRLECRIF